MASGGRARRSSDSAAAPLPKLPEWGVYRVVRTERRKNEKGKMVNMALLEWEPTWVPIEDLEKETQAMADYGYITVLGPLASQNEEDYLRVRPMEMDWAIARGDKRYAISYTELKARFYPELLDYFEAIVRSSTEKKLQKERLAEKAKNEKAALGNKEKKKNTAPQSETARMSTSGGVPPNEKKSTGRRSARGGKK